MRDGPMFPGAPGTDKIDHIVLKDGRRIFPFLFEWKGYRVWVWGTGRDEALARANRQFPSEVKLAGHQPELPL